MEESSRLSSEGLPDANNPSDYFSSTASAQMNKSPDFSKIINANSHIGGCDLGKVETGDVCNNSCTKVAKIILLGLRRSGKTSIYRVVFEKVAPNETLFNESTSRVNRDKIINSSFFRFECWDMPGSQDFCEAALSSSSTSANQGSSIFSFLNANNNSTGGGAVLSGSEHISLIFVVDAQDDFIEPLKKVIDVISRCMQMLAANKDSQTVMKFNIFIHKVDGLSDDQKVEIQRAIFEYVKEQLQERQNVRDASLRFYMTSIYDNSIFEAFSKVLQQLTPQLPILENLLNIFTAGSGIEKVFLCDVVSKLYLATDSSPVDMHTYELCCDMLDVVIDISCIYGLASSVSNSAESNAPNTNSSSTSAGLTTDCCPFDAKSASIIELANEVFLYLRQVDKYLALIFIVRGDNFKRKGLIDYNFERLREGIFDLFAVKKS